MIANFTMLPMLLALQDQQVQTAPRDGADLFLPPDYANFGSQVDMPFWFITWICLFFFVLIVSLMVWFMFKYNRERGAKTDPAAPTHHTPLELLWSIIPLILVIMMFYYGFHGYIEMATPPSNAYQIDTTGQRWYWTFQYPDGTISGSGLHVPPDVPVKLLIKSTDVLHAVFIPDFRVKKDAVPGRFSTLWFIARHSGKIDGPETHHLFCAEYCGTSHSDMHDLVTVHPTMESFEQWLKDEADPYSKGMPLEAVGDMFYQTRGCKGCHTIDGTSKIGPSFKDTWRQINDATRMLDNGRINLDDYDGMAENYIVESLWDPQKRIAEGLPRSMPTQKGQLDELDISAIIAYLKWLQDNDGSPWEIWKEEQKKLKEGG